MRRLRPEVEFIGKYQLPRAAGAVYDGEFGIIGPVVEHMMDDGAQGCNADAAAYDEYVLSPVIFHREPVAVRTPDAQRGARFKLMQSSGDGTHAPDGELKAGLTLSQ